MPNDYYEYRGVYDFWRFPLVYPYSLYCIDATDNGQIRSEKGIKDLKEGGFIEPLTEYFDLFTLDKSFFVGHICAGHFEHDKVIKPESFFIFSFADGKITNFQGIAKIKKELKRIKFTGSLKLMSIREYDEKL